MAERDEILSFEEIERLVALFASMGVDDVRLTGGEPLVRREFPSLASLLAASRFARPRSRRTVSCSTRRRAVASGLNRFNVSVDCCIGRSTSYAPRRAGPGLRGLEVLESSRGPPDQVQRGRNPRVHRDEVLPMAGSRGRIPYEVRFIEFMPLDADHSWDRRRCSAAKRSARRSTPCTPLEAEPREPSATAASPLRRRAGQDRFINPVSEPFCGDCDRIRMTADGQLRTCLFSLHEYDLRAPLRDGASDVELRELIRDAVGEGAQAPRQRPGLRPAGPDDVADRRLNRSPSRFVAPRRGEVTGR